MSAVVDLDEELLECIEKGDVQKARSALDSGANANAKDHRSGMYTVHYAAYVKTSATALDLVRGFVFSYLPGETPSFQRGLLECSNKEGGIPLVLCHCQKSCGCC